MGEIEEFNPLTFEKRLTQLKDTQESIQSLSSWCLKQREHHKKIVASWLNVLKRVKVEQRLVLFYLANDVIQYSKRKNYEFVESWGLNLQKATPLVRDEKVRHKILRIFKIWEQRAVYDEEFLSDLTGLLSAGAVKKTDDDPLDFQPQQLVNKIKQCTVLEADTDLRLKNIHENPLDLSDADALCANLKDRSNKDDVEKELNEGIQCVERYTQALQREIVAREALLALLPTANQYYSTQRGEVKVVAYAYKNFGARVRALKRKLDSLIPNLPPAAPSPPQRDEDVPSPGPDEDLDLPSDMQAADSQYTPSITEDELNTAMSYDIDRTFNTSMTVDGSLYNLGLSSFLSSDNPMAFLNDSEQQNNANNSNKIEVINSRPNEKQDFDINSFLKTLVPNENNAANSDSNSGSGIITPADPSLPGLDLLTDNPPPPTSFYGSMNTVNGSGIITPADPSLPRLDLHSANPPPPTSFYGSMNTVSDDQEYHPEVVTRWNNTSWSLPPAPVPPPTMPLPPPPIPAIPVADISESNISVSNLTNIPVSNISSIPVSNIPSISASNIPVSNFSSSNIPVSNIPASNYTSANIPVSTISMADMMSMAVFRDTPESPPPAPPPPPAPVVTVYTCTPDLPPADVDHRGLLPPPPPPPVLPLLGNIEDVDHRLLPSIPPPPSPAPALNRHPQQDVDHRNLISLSHQPAVATRPTDPRTAPLDQDYRVPPLIPPRDLVDVVDMDLSEDEDQQGVYPNQNEHRRNSFNNNKVLVGGDNGKTNHKEHPNLVQINRDFPEHEHPHSAPVMPMSNPFDNMPVGLKNLNIPFNSFPNEHEENSNDSAYEDDLRSRGIEQLTQPPEFENFMDFDERSRPFNNQRFPRNWGPRTNFRQPFGQHVRPWSGPRPPPNRWMGPRQRFW